jgi:hypothetical protein
MANCRRTVVRAVPDELRAELTVAVPRARRTGQGTWLPDSFEVSRKNSSPRHAIRVGAVREQARYGSCAIVAELSGYDQTGSRPAIDEEGAADRNRDCDVWHGRGSLPMSVFVACAA